MKRASGLSFALLCVALTAPVHSSAQSAARPAEILAKLNSFLKTYCANAPSLRLEPTGKVVRQDTTGRSMAFRFADLNTEYGMDMDGEAHVIVSCKDDKPCIEHGHTTSSFIVFSINPPEQGSEFVRLLDALRAATTEEHLDGIVARHVAARGGAEKWAALQTLVVISRSDAFSYDRVWKAPDRARIDNFMSIPSPPPFVRAFDGRTCWGTVGDGAGTPRVLSPEECSVFQSRSDMYWELIDYKSRGHRLELVGRETLDGRAAWRLRLTRRDGQAADLFLDAATYLEFQRVSRVQTPSGEDVALVTSLGRYHPVGGLLLPHSIADATVVYRVNEPIDDAVFRMPGGADGGSTALWAPGAR